MPGQFQGTPGFNFIRNLISSASISLLSPLWSQGAHAVRIGCTRLLLTARFNEELALRPMCLRP